MGYKLTACEGCRKGQRSGVCSETNVPAKDCISTSGAQNGLAVQVEESASLSLIGRFALLHSYWLNPDSPAPSLNSCTLSSDHCTVFSRGQKRCKMMCVIAGGVLKHVCRGIQTRAGDMIMHHCSELSWSLHCIQYWITTPAILPLRGFL